jgi:hypothetical protein
MALKHVGRFKSNQRKVIVAYRTLPNDADHCVVVQTENLDSAEHDALIKAVESDAGQNANEFAEAMARNQLPDGRNMLAGFHTTGKMLRVPTNTIEMTPDMKTTIMLDELNKVIAEQKGVAVEDLAIKDPSAGKTQTSTESTTQDTTVDTLATVSDIPAPKSDGVLTDEDLAAQYRSQADAMFKEAKRLREQAEELVPTKKKSVKASA